MENNNKQDDIQYLSENARELAQMIADNSLEYLEGKYRIRLKGYATPLELALIHALRKQIDDESRGDYLQNALRIEELVGNLRGRYNSDPRN